MKNVEKADRVHLGRLVEELKRGYFVIPDFQREFEWAPWDVLELIRSIFMDYYIGTLLLWKGSKDNFKLLSCEPIYAHNGPDDRQHIVLDGQQRLTAIYYAFFNPGKNFPRRKGPIAYFVKIDALLAEDYENAFSYNSITKVYKVILDDITSQFALHLFPLKVMSEGTWGTSDWIKGYRDYWQARADEESQKETTGEEFDSEKKAKYEQYVSGAKDFKDQIEELFNQYYISYIELDKDIDVSKVCEIFTQINSKGVRLDIFDLLNAILRPKEIFLKQMWQEAQPTLAYIDDRKMKVYVLTVMSILAQAYCSAKFLYYLVPGATRTMKKDDRTTEQIVLVQDSESFVLKWRESVAALKKAIDSLKNPRDYGAITVSFLPYPSIIPSFAAIKRFAEASESKNKIDMQTKIRKWYWASIFTNRYSSGVESTSTKDFQALKRWFEDDDAEPETISDFQARYRSLDLLNEDKKGSAIYNAIFNLFIINEARDWSTFELPEYDTLDDHHIVPIAAFEEIAGPSINSILNRTPLSPDTNRHVINKKMPNVYMKEMLEHNDPEKVYAVLASHLVSKKAVEILLRDPFTKDDFSEFLDERRRTILDAIESKLIKETIAVPAALKDLNDKIEQVEFAIRKLIVERLTAASLTPLQEYTPQPIRDKVEERVRKEIKKNPGAKPEDYISFEKQVSFFDLQEYFQIMTTKAAWEHFADVFNDRTQLQMRFNQMAGLRNGIRHSREISEIERMDGETGIAYFRKALKIA